MGSELTNFSRMDAGQYGQRLDALIVVSHPIYYLLSMPAELIRRHVEALLLFHLVLPAFAFKLLLETHLVCRSRAPA